MIAQRRQTAKKNEEVWLQYHWAALARPASAADDDERNETNNARLISLARPFPAFYLHWRIYIFLVSKEKKKRT